MSDPAWVHPSSVVDDGAVLGAGTRVWHFSHVMSGARIGEDCSFGQNCFVAGSVVVGDGCRIQNNVSLYDGVQLGERVFVGPSAVFTNVTRPRAGFPRREEYEPTLVGADATIGANATIRCGARLGEGAFVAAGAVVLDDVPSFRMVAGVPARPIGWACRCGEALASTISSDTECLCARCGRGYRLAEHGLSETRSPES